MSCKICSAPVADFRYACTACAVSQSVCSACLKKSGGQLCAHWQTATITPLVVSVSSPPPLVGPSSSSGSKPGPSGPPTAKPAFLEETKSLASSFSFAGDDDDDDGDGPAEGTAPTTMGDILSRRAKATAALSPKPSAPPSSLSLAPASAALTDGSAQFAINIPSPLRTFSVVVWNVQTFFPSRVEKNPLLRLVVRDVLDALDVDVAVFLESRNDPYINMNAIDAALALDPDVAPDDEKEDEPHSPEELEALAGVASTFVQLASPMTGKMYRPPERVLLYGGTAHGATQHLIVEMLELDRLSTGGDLTKAETTRRAKLAKKMELGLSGRKKESSAPDPATQQLFESARKRKAQKGACAYAEAWVKTPKLNAETTLGPRQQPANWAYWYRDQTAVFEEYYEILWNDEPVEVDRVIEFWEGSRGADFDLTGYAFRLKRCDECEQPLGYGMGCESCADRAHGSTSLENLAGLMAAVTYEGPRQPNMESYAVVYRPAASSGMASSQGVFCREGRAILHPLTAGLLDRESGKMADGKATVGPLLGYQKKSSAYYGRCPYSFSMSINPAGFSGPITLPLVAFHGPYGKDTAAGIQARADALTAIMNAGRFVSTPTGVSSLRMGEMPYALVMGDFNLDYQPEVQSKAAGRKIAAKVYEAMTSKGFIPQLEGICTSLTSIPTGAKRKKLDSVLPTGPATNFTSSAYDNIFVRSAGDRGALPKAVANAGAIDMIEFVARGVHAARYTLPADDPDAEVYAKLRLEQKAFYLYRRFVSDHLPLLLDIVVQPFAPATPLPPAPARRAFRIEQTEITRAEVTTQPDLISYGRVRLTKSRYVDVVGTIRGTTATHFLLVTADAYNTFEWQVPLTEPGIDGAAVGKKLWARLESPSVK